MTRVLVVIEQIIDFDSDDITNFDANFTESFSPDSPFIHIEAGEAGNSE